MPEERAGGVDDGGNRCVIASDASIDNYFQRRFALPIGWRHAGLARRSTFDVERDDDFTIHFAFGVLMNAAGLAFLHPEKLCLDVLPGDDGIADFSDVGDLPAQGMADKRQGILQSRMAGFAFLQQLAKRGWVWRLPILRCKGSRRVEAFTTL